MEFDHSSGYSPRACKRCKQLKIKCDKTIPKCRSCTKSHFKCLYHELSKSRLKSETGSSATPSAVIEPSVSLHDGAPYGFPPTHFLDYCLFQRTVTEIPRVITAVPPDLQALTEDIREQANSFFRTIHPWIPFLSKKSFYERLLSPFTHRSIDIVLLFASIKLICTHPEGENVRTAAYVTVKSAILQAEIAGVFTIRMLQAWILLCLYEIGHAIYPSAYLSIGTCAKYATALGVNTSETDFLGQKFCGIEAEERIRTWWALVILDRFSNLGCQRPSLSSEDPSNGTKIPIDDASWDRGEVNYGHANTLSTPPTALMGRYGLTAQAASLMGRVLHHINDTHKETAFYQEEDAILHRTLSALTVVANEEGRARGIGVCTPTVLCHSSRIALSERAYDAASENHYSDQDKILYSEIAGDIIRLSQWATSDVGLQLDDEMSLFPLDTAYRIFAAYLDMYHKKRIKEYPEGFWHIKSLLTMYNKRWKIAGAYIKMIEAREAIYASNCA